MTISLLLLTIALTGPADLRAVVDSTKPPRQVARPAPSPRAIAKPIPKPAPKPVGEPVLKRRRSPA